MFSTLSFKKFPAEVKALVQLQGSEGCNFHREASYIFVKPFSSNTIYFFHIRQFIFSHPVYILSSIWLATLRHQIHPLRKLLVCILFIHAFSLIYFPELPVSQTMSIQRRLLEGLANNKMETIWKAALISLPLSWYFANFTSIFRISAFSHRTRGILND